MNTGTNEENPATLADIIRARRVRKGKADGIDANGAWWLQAGHGCVHIGGPTIDRHIALVTTCDAVGVANARLISRAPEMLDALAACVAAGEDLQAGKRDGATMGRVSLATDAARALLAFTRGAETQPRPDPLDVLRDVLQWYAHSADADGDMPPELHTRLIRAVGGEVAP